MNKNKAPHVIYNMRYDIVITFANHPVRKNPDSDFRYLWVAC